MRLPLTPITDNAMKQRTLIVVGVGSIGAGIATYFAQKAAAEQKPKPQPEAPNMLRKGQKASLTRE